jgi:endo-1,4-beta-mannosidase
MNPLPCDRLRFGVNYVPSRKWWYCWNDFHADEIARDFDAIALLGADHIRIMLLWPYFQPNRTWISGAHLDRLEVLMSLAKERNLDVCVTMLTGWLSGWAFRPTFDRPDDFYTAQELQEPVEQYFRACGERLNRHANFSGFDLGNEINCCWKSKNTTEGDAWMGSILDLCESISPQAVHVNGVDHQPWFYQDTFSAAGLAQRQKLIPIHAWIEFTGALKRGGSSDRVCTHLAPAMAALTRAYAGEPTKPVWLQEFGTSSHWVEEEKIPDFLTDAIYAGVKGGICQFTWWASHDILPEYQFNPMEYDMGLIDTENRLKPAGLAFQKLAREFAGKPVSMPAGLQIPPLPKPSMEETWKWLEAVQQQLP